MTQQQNKGLEIARPYPTNTILSISKEAIGYSVSLSAPSSAVWPTANKAFYAPFYLWRDVSVSKMFLLNGSAVSGNLEMGIYSTSGVRLATTGSVAQAGTNSCQRVNLQATINLGMGQYFMALVINNGTGAVMRKSVASPPLMNMFGYFQQTTAFPLPATATFASFTAGSVFVFGIKTINV